MSIPPRREFTWENAAERWRRFGEANERATADGLRSLTLEEGIAIFEELCEGFPELGEVDPPDDPPVVLFKLWRDA
ncbi:MAG: hypothetical protein HY720_01305 [Planctomycetes bacterium]|nr:hypothetical protein [Planctomycetota bacterium]